MAGPDGLRHVGAVSLKLATLLIVLAELTPPVVTFCERQSDGRELYLGWVTICGQ